MTCPALRPRRGQGAGLGSRKRALFLLPRAERLPGCRVLAGAVHPPRLAAPGRIPVSTGKLRRPGAPPLSGPVVRRGRLDRGPRARAGDGGGRAQEPRGDPARRPAGRPLPLLSLAEPVQRHRGHEPLGPDTPTSSRVPLHPGPHSPPPRGSGARAVEARRYGFLPRNIWHGAPAQLRNKPGTARAWDALDAVCEKLLAPLCQSYAVVARRPATAER